jgi:hypothetical protein
MPTILPGSTPAAGPENSEILAHALQRVEAGDPGSAVAAIAAIRDPIERARTGSEFIAAVADRAPAVAAAMVPEWRLGLSRTADIERIATRFVQADPDAALRWAIGLGDAATASTARRAIAGELVSRDARDAIARIDALPDGAAREMLAGFVAAAWARRQPAEAEAWVRILPAGERRQRLVSSVAFEVAQTDPRRALALADLLPPGRNRWLLVAACAQTWVAQDLHAAFAWANQLPAGDEREAALAGATAGLGAGRLRLGGDLDIAAVSGGRPAVGGAALSGPLDSPAFAAWRATQPEYLSPEEAAIEYVRQRANVAPLAVGQWVAGLPGGSTRERAIDAYLETSAPATAAQWLATLAPSDRTSDRIERVAEQFLQMNPAAAETWLNGMMLPADRKEFLLRQAGR